MADILRFSRQVPADAVNLAWIELPQLDPVANISLVETARYIAENIDLAWREALGSAVDGVDIATDALSGNVYVTNYNYPVSGSFASGAVISPGVAHYEVPRAKTQEVSPSGFLVENFTSQIRVLHPEETESGVWHCRIVDGVIVRRHTLLKIDQSWLSKVFDPGDELVLYYTLPEFLRVPYMAEGASGSFYHDNRVMDVSGAVATLLDEKTLRVGRQDLFEVLSVTVNGDELITAASGRLILGTRERDAQEPPRGPFTAWDPINGILTLSRSVNLDDEVRVSFRYREYLYVFNGYVDDAGGVHYLDLNPSPGHTYDQGRPGSELLSLPIYLYLLPTAAYRRVDAAGNVAQARNLFSGLRWHNSFLRWERTAASIAVDTPVATNCIKRVTFGSSHFGQGVFVDELPVEDLVVNAAGAPSAPPAGSGLAALPSAVVLAKLYVTSDAQIANVNLVDTRSRGGGIPTDVDPEDPRLPGDTRRQIETYWDLGGWDGQPVPLAGVLLVELPGGLLDGSNGYTKFSQDELERIVKTSVAAGVKVVIRYV